MSQLEQTFGLFLNRHPEIETCYQAQLINRRSLARDFIRQGHAKPNQFDAVVAMLRRYPFKRLLKRDFTSFRTIRVNIKDKILILDFEKEKELLPKLQKLIAHTNYDKGDTLKIVVGSTSISVFIDEEKEGALKDVFEQFTLKHRYQHMSEISLLFSDKANESKGILSTLTKEFVMNEIAINELLTAGSELLLYLKEEHVLHAYEIIKRLQQL